MKHLKEMQILNQKKLLRGMAAKMTPYQDQKRENGSPKGKKLSYQRSGVQPTRTKGISAEKCK